MLTILFDKDSVKPFVRDRHTYNQQTHTQIPQIGTEMHTVIQQTDTHRYNGTENNDAGRFIQQTEGRRHREPEGENSNPDSLLVKGRQGVCF